MFDLASATVPRLPRHLPMVEIWSGAVYTFTMVQFTKLTGAGNDFVVAVPGSDLDGAGSAHARRLCSRRDGVGVDGLILVYPENGDGVRVRFFNPDGSEFSTCGNGTRCAARFAADRGLVGRGRPFTIVTSAGPIEARVDEDRVTLEYLLPADRQGPLTVDGPWGMSDGWFLHFGVPHFVLPVDRMPDGPIETICAPIRHDARLGPDGANVNLIEMRSRGAGRIRTFERGVEGETLACGSGSMASVIAVWAADAAERTVELDVQGGETLTIELVDEPVFDGTPIRVRLGGPAVTVFEGEFPGIDEAE